MTTLPVAIAALRFVGLTRFAAQVSDPTWGALYTATVFKDEWPFEDAHPATPSVYVYEMAGLTTKQGLGTTKTWRKTRVRLDIWAHDKAEARQLFEAVRAAWITDMNYSAGNGTVGQGYLRDTGGLKDLLIGEAQTTSVSKRAIIFRRFADVYIEIGD